MNLADELDGLHGKLAQLEQGDAVVGDWHRFEARAARALVRGQSQLAYLQRQMIELVRIEPPDPRWFGLLSNVHTLRDLMQEIRMVRLCAESRIIELQAEANQREFSNWSSTGRA